MRWRLTGTSIIVLWCALGPTARTARAQATSVVHGVARVDRDTCCGVLIRPGSQCSVTQPYTGRVTVRRGSHNVGRVVTRANVGADGSFTLTLSPGTYCLVGDDKSLGRPGSAGPAESGECMMQYLSECDAVIHVPASAAVEMRVHRTCYGPCVRAPMPP